MNIKVTQTEVKSPHEIIELLKNEGYKNVFEWSDPSGSKYGWHTHPYEEVRWVTRGSIVIGHKNGETTLYSGDRMDIKAGTEHWAQSDEGVGYICGSKE
ncbi:MAG: cupin domain-containing protein [Nitrospinae bacterium]|nr:cupin domain-containing protein [Nitrospinota bacterium]